MSVLLIALSLFTQKDSTPIKQEIFFSNLLQKYVLVTNNGELFDSVVHGDSLFIEAQKRVEFEKALARRKAVAIVTVKCK